MDATSSSGSDSKLSAKPPDTTRTAPINISQKKSFLARHYRAIVILVLIAALGGMYFWKNAAVSNAKTVVANRANTFIGEQNRTYLRLVGIPLVWAVRSEMLRDNYEQVNQYLALYVKEKSINALVVARQDGIIVAATDKKLQDSKISEFFPSNVTDVETITISIKDTGEYQVVSPIMGLNEKIGVLILVCAPAQFTAQ